MCHIPTSAFKDLPVGTRFVLTHKTPHGSVILEKTEPAPVPHPKEREESWPGLFYTAKWCDGPHANKPCVIPHGPEKDPYQIIPLP